MKSRVFIYIVLGISLGLSGCVPSALKSAATSAFKFEEAKVWLQSVQFNVASDVNGNAPVTADILVFYDAEVMKKIAKLTADKYFAQKDQLKKDYGDQIDFFSYEIVPGQRMKEQNIDLSKATGVGAVAFARYSTPGPHRITVGPDRIIRLELEKNDFKITVVKS